MNDTIYNKETVKGVVNHMNDDHSDACLAIVQALGSSPTAENAIMAGMDANGVDFSIVTNDGETSDVRVQFSKPITRESQIRGHLVALTKQARAQLKK
ncbi:MAG: DUF2470 domain-containing protein [Granulosicoccus sp.]